jgi:hypothetical protein
MKRNAIALAVACLFAAPVVFAALTPEERLDSLQKELEGMKNLQQEVNEIKAQLAQQKEQNAALADQMEKSSKSADAAGGNTSVGGYGEVTYSHFTKDGQIDKADLDRFVLFFGHRFNERLSFNSELEIEHAISSATDAGEVELEQAYVNYRVRDAFNIKTGLILIPLGILNEKHEPPTFYGVKRNDVETRIIPTTWREGGIGVHGNFAKGFKYDIGITTGFDAGKIDAPTQGIRSGHQELSKANANDLSLYGALNYTGTPGLLVGGGVFSGNTGQDGASNPLLKGVAARLTLADVHAFYSIARFDLQALYARGTLGDADKINAALLTTAAPFAAPKTLSGWYTQAAYHAWIQGDFDLAPFVRYERINITQLEDPANGLFQDPNNRDRIITTGLNFKVHPQVVFKADYQNFQTNKSRDSINLGMGYMF